MELRTLVEKKASSSQRSRSKLSKTRKTKINLEKIFLAKDVFLLLYHRKSVRGSKIATVFSIQSQNKDITSTFFLIRLRPPNEKVFGASERRREEIGRWTSSMLSPHR